MTAPTIRDCTDADVPRICDIYNHYIRETVVTFEETPIAVAEMAGRIAAIRKRFPWLVIESEGAVAGYAYAGPWKTRSAYRFAIESTIYLAADALGRGLGTALYSRLLAALPQRDAHRVLGCIALPNEASVALHEKLGFKKIGIFNEVGWKFGRWVDVGYWGLTYA
ncbi:MAG: arsinothricin resistance N-acetyltransferase ArsN1 family B [Gammaproteobacteria bacterium]